MKILCATDFSTQAAEGVRVASILATRSGGELRLVSAVGGMVNWMSAEDAELLRTATSDRLVSRASSLQATLPGLRVSSEMLEGRPDRAIATSAGDWGADLMVVGSAGHADDPLYRLGGISERLALRSDVPLLVIREAAPFERWFQGGAPLRVLVGVTQDDACEPALAWARRLRLMGPCDVIGAHVYLVPDARRRYGLSPVATWLDADPELERLLARDIERRIGDLGGQGTVSVRVSHGIGRVGDDLVHLAEQERADLMLVSGQHTQRVVGRVGSTSSGALHFGKMAVLRAPADPAQAFDRPREVATVLAATDFSEPSLLAVRYAYAMAREEVVLVHVADKEPATYERRAELAARLRELVPHEASARGVATRTAVLSEADVPHAISTAAERFGADAICVAQRSRGAAARALLGSVTDRLLRESLRPVMVIPVR